MYVEARAMVSPNRIQSPLATQGSVYNLSFNDIQDQLGRPLNRMNIDELLKSVTNTNSTGGGAPAASASASENNNNNNHHNITSSSSNHQLDTSTVKNVSSPSPSSLSSSSSSSPPAPFTFTHKSLNTTPAPAPSNEAFAQTTLEDFLLRHGGFDVDVDNPQPLASTMDPMIVVSQPQPGDWLQFPINEQHRQMEVLASHLPPPTTTPLLADVPYSDNQPMPMVVPVPVPVPPCIHPAPERKRRISDEMLKTTIERKQKRMIKNRESAARSRARKQAYTNKLEHQVAQLRKLNNMLSKEKEVAALFPLDPAKPKHQLRRTSSATF